MTWDDAKFLAFDFETSGELPEYALQPWRVAQGKSWATSLVWVWRQGTTEVAGGLMPDRERMEDMLRFALFHDMTLVGWNVAFDISWLLAYGLEDLVMKCKWLDGMLLWRHWFIEPEYEIDRGKKKSYGLKAAVAEYIPNHAGYEEDVDFHDPSPEARRKLHAYNVKDTKFTLKLAKAFYEALRKENPQRLKAALIEAACLPLVAKANLDGMWIDTVAASELRSSLTKTAAEKLEKLAPYGVTEKVVRSPLQLAKLLYDDWGLPVLKENTGKKTGKVSRATSKDVLHELAFKDERARDIKQYREALNNRTKFAEAPLVAAAYNEDGRAHPLAIPFGTYSGRFTYSSQQGRNKDMRQIGFALHQEKRDAVFREIVQAPLGYTIVEFDAAGQEFRWMAIASGDETMLTLCLPGEDPHSFMGAQVTHIDYRTLVEQVAAKADGAKEKRQLGKVANLSLQYRTSARKLRSVARVQYDIPMELPEAQHVWKTYQRSYPGVPRYWNRQIAFTRNHGYVETFAGRRVQVVGNWGGDMAWSMGSTAINYRIQGTGADQKYLALAVLRPYLVKHGAYFAWDLHDGLYFYVPDAKVQKFVSEVGYILNNLPYKKAWDFIPPIPLPWDCKTGKTWGGLKEVNQ